MPSANSANTRDLTPMTKDQAISLVNRLMGSFPSRASFPDPETFLSSMAALFVQYPLWAGERAVDGHIHASPFVPTLADMKTRLEEQVRVPRYAVEWDQEAQKQAQESLRIAGPVTPRPTLDELKAKYGPAWGMKTILDEQDEKARKRHLAQLSDANRRLLEIEFNDLGENLPKNSIPVSPALREKLTGSPRNPVGSAYVRPPEAGESRPWRTEDPPEVIPAGDWRVEPQPQPQPPAGPDQRGDDDLGL